MKRLLPALLLFMLAAFSCRKEESPVTPNHVKDSIITYQPPNNTKATITSISPASGTTGTVVTITGTNLGNSATVSFNGVTGIIQSTTATEIKVIAPQSDSGNILLATIDNQTITGPAFTYAMPVIAAISPTSGASGTVVTITGTNLGTSYSGAQLLFNGVSSSIQSITPTEIKAIVPVTTTGKVTLTVGKHSTVGPVFTYVSVLSAPYTSGDVILKSQADVDAFVNQNKGRQLQIMGNLTVSGADITSVSGLSNITSVSGAINLLTCPLLTDVSFLNGITSAGSISFQNLMVTTITMDKLAGSTGFVLVSTCKNLSSLSCRALTNVKGNFTLLSADIRIVSCEQLSNVNFNSLVSIANVLYLYNTAISDLSGFSSIQTTGALTLSSNPSLVNFHGLEQLTTLTLPGVSGVINGLYISGNPKLSSLTGLQNLTAVPLARVTSNTTLNDFCPLKQLITKLSSAPGYSYKTPSSIVDVYNTVFVPALTLTNNSSYITTADGLAAVKLCN